MLGYPKRTTTVYLKTVKLSFLVTKLNTGRPSRQNLKMSEFLDVDDIYF